MVIALCQGCRSGCWSDPRASLLVGGEPAAPKQMGHQAALLADTSINVVQLRILKPIEIVTSVEIERWVFGVILQIQNGSPADWLYHRQKQFIFLNLSFSGCKTQWTYYWWCQIQNGRIMAILNFNWTISTIFGRWQRTVHSAIHLLFLLTFC